MLSSVHCSKKGLNDYKCRSSGRAALEEVVLSTFPGMFGGLVIYLFFRCLGHKRRLYAFGVRSAIIFRGSLHFTLALRPPTAVLPPISHLSHQCSNSLGVFVQSDWLDGVGTQGCSPRQSCKLQLSRRRLVRFQSPSENTVAIMIIIIIIIVTW